MPADDVSDLRDVVDAINRLCETMKTSESSDHIEPESEVREDVVENVELVQPEDIVVNEVETYVAELWSDASSAWNESVENITLDATDEVTDTVVCIPPPEVIENVITVTANRVNVQTIPTNDPVESAEIVTSNQIVTQFENVAVVLDLAIDQSKNLEIVSNETVTQVEGTTVESPRLARVENKTGPAYRSATQIGTVESTSDRSPPRPEDIRTVVSDPDLLTMSCEPASEMYYTASSEVSLLSDFDMPDRVQESLDGRDTARDDRNGVMAGHVAAMRERFESMTRTNTPCPDTMRSVSPSLDVFRNITPSPDHLG